MGDTVFLRVNILSVFLCVVASLNRKLRTAVKTSEAHGAFVFDPHGFSVSDFNCILGAFFGTHSAADAGVFNRKTACSAQILIVFIEIIGKRNAFVIKIAVFLFINLFYDCFSCFICLEIEFCVFIIIG